MISKDIVVRTIKEGFLMSTAEKQRQLQAMLQQVEQMGEEIDEAQYARVIEILRSNV